MPVWANLRKHKRQIPNKRIKPRGRPQMWHLLWYLTLYFNFFDSLTIFAVVAIFYFFSKGNPRADNNIFASSFEVAEIFKVTCNGRILVILSRSISGK